MPELCKVEYLTPAGWQHGHAGNAFVDPQRYVDTMFDRRGKVTRLTALDDMLQPLGIVYLPANAPGEPALVPDPAGGRMPVVACSICGEGGHKFEGECLL